MKKNIISLMLAIASMCFFNVNEAAASSATIMELSSVTGKKDYKTVVFDTKLHCDKCVRKVMENISYEKGVKNLKVELATNTIEIVYDAKKTDEAKLAAAIKKLGYPAVKRMTNN